MWGCLLFGGGGGEGVCSWGCVCSLGVLLLGGVCSLGVSALGGAWWRHHPTPNPPPTDTAAGGMHPCILVTVLVYFICVTTL